MAQLDLKKLQAEIQLAAMLFSFGLASYDKIREYFAEHSDVNDDAVLAAIMAEVDWRIARRKADSAGPLP